MNQSSPVDVTEFLIALALALEDELGADGDGIAEPWFDRFQGLLRRLNVSIAAGPVSGSISTGGVAVAAHGLSVEVNLKDELKSSEPFVEELRQKLSYHLGELRREVASFCGDVVSRHLERTGDHALVMIVDSLEKVRGTTANDDRVQESIKQLLVHHADKLRFESHHIVYTVPPYLRFTDPGRLPYDGSVRPVPIPHVRQRDGTADEASIQQLVQVVRQRIPWEELLGDDAALRAVIRASGGHLRMLFTLLQELIMLANARGAPLPAESSLVAETIDKVALGFSSITEEDAAFLVRVEKAAGEFRPLDAHEVSQMAKLLHTHMILEHLNGDTWYEVHPLARRALGLT